MDVNNGTLRSKGNPKIIYSFGYSEKLRDERWLTSPCTNPSTPNFAPNTLESDAIDDRTIAYVNAFIPLLEPPMFNIKVMLPYKIVANVVINA